MFTFDPLWLYVAVVLFASVATGISVYIGAAHAIFRFKYELGLPHSGLTALGAGFASGAPANVSAIWMLTHGDLVESWFQGGTAVAVAASYLTVALGSFLVFQLLVENLIRWQARRMDPSIRFQPTAYDVVVRRHTID